MTISVTCHFKRGDGNGHHERYGGYFTKEQCVAEAQKRIKNGEKINGKPITGITMRWSCSGNRRCSCFFEYGMHGSSWQSFSSKWKSCLFMSQSEAKHCKWSSWGRWSECSKSCGGGSQEKRRTVATTAKYGGRECQGRSSRTRSCKTQPCPGKIILI